MDAAPDKSVDAAPPGGEVAEDRPCRQCGYNLRGLRADGKCPECATPVVMSIREPLLRYSPPAYVRKLRRGIRLTTLGLSIVSWAFALFLVLIVLMLINANLAGALTALLSFPLMLASLVAVICLLLGPWFFTTPSPAVFAAQPEDRTARVARACLALGLCGVVLSQTVAALSPPMPFMALLEFAVVGFAVVGTIGMRAYFRHVAEIAQRIPDDKLAKDAQSIAYVATLALALLLGVRAIHVTVTWLPVLLAGAAPTAVPAGGTGLPGPASSATSIINTWATPLLGLVLLVQVSKTITLHKRLRPLVKRAWQEAEEFWGSRAASKPTGG